MIVCFCCVFVFVCLLLFLVFWGDGLCVFWRGVVAVVCLFVVVFSAPNENMFQR